MPTYTVKAGETVRVDVFLSNKNPALGRSFVQKLIHDQLVLVNSEPARSSHKLKEGDVVKLVFDLETLNDRPEIKLPIIYEDNDTVVINKPIGLLSHAKGQVSLEPTVATFIQSLSDQVSGNRSGIVHRLDRSTSGVMIGAKNEDSRIKLQKQFSERKVKKNYVAIVVGKPEHASAIIDMPIARNPKNPSQFRVDLAGKSATTEYELIRTNNGYSEVVLQPRTGRTHQLRVHLAKIGTPIVGDELYGGPPADRVYLHAKSLDIRLPGGELKHFGAKLPPEFDKLMTKHD